MTRLLGTRVLAAGAALVLPLGLAAPALAATASLDDPSGDAMLRGLDVTRASVDNRDHAIVTRVRFERAKRGELIVSVDPRRARGVRLISRYRPGGNTTSFVVDGAFTDRAAGDSPLDCDGFRARWDAENERVRLTLPSTCLQDADYGAVRFQVLTEEAGGGGDADDTSASGWIPRG